LACDVFLVSGVENLVMQPPEQYVLVYSGWRFNIPCAVSLSTRKLDADQIPLNPIAEKDGNALVLRCRTPAEAYLISEELEKEDIVVVLPESEELLSDYKRNGCVEVRVSGRAYESVSDLKSVVEFQYKQLRSELPLTHAAKAAALFCVAMPVPGVLVFVGLLSGYRKHGYDRRAKQFKRWYFIGLALYVLILVESPVAVNIKILEAVRTCSAPITGYFCAPQAHSTR